MSLAISIAGGILLAVVAAVVLFYAVALLLIALSVVTTPGAILSLLGIGGSRPNPTTPGDKTGNNTADPG